MTNNEPLSGDLSNESNANRADGRAVPVDANDLPADDGMDVSTAGSSDTGSEFTANAEKGKDGSNLGDLGDPAHPFDQTNGIVEGLEGDSDEADGDDSTPA